MREKGRLKGYLVCAVATLMAVLAFAAPSKAWAADAEASVSVDGVATEYATFEEAIAAANAVAAGKEVKVTLLKDAAVAVNDWNGGTETRAVIFSRNMSIDGAGHSIATENTSDSNHNLIGVTAQDVTISNVALTGQVFVESSGQSIDGSVTFSNVSGSWNLNIQSGDVTLAGGTVVDDVDCGGGSTTIESATIGWLTTEGGSTTFLGGSVDTVFNFGTGTTYLYGGTVNGRVNNSSSDGFDNTVYIKGASVKSDIVTAGGKTYIESGTFNYNFVKAKRPSGGTDSDCYVYVGPGMTAGAISTEGGTIETWADVGGSVQAFSSGSITIKGGLIQANVQVEEGATGSISMVAGCVIGSISSDCVSSTSRAISLDDNNGGSKKGTLVVPSPAGSATVSALYTPERSGHTFKGWYTAKTGGTQVKAGDAVSKLDGVTTLYARWDDYEEEAPTFSDVNYTDWYGDGVATVAKAGLMKGYGGTSYFGVGKTMTRAELAQILFRASGGDPDAAYPANSTGMEDVEDGQWYTRAANWAVANKVINGYEGADGSRSFGPYDPVTFEQLVKILASYCDAEGSPAHSAASLSGFEDASAVDSWAASYMAWAVDKGLVEGYGGKTLAPLEEVARERAATVIARAMGLGLLKVE